MSSVMSTATRRTTTPEPPAPPGFWELFHVDPPPPEPLIDDDHTGLRLMEVLPAEGDDERVIGHAFRLVGEKLGKLDSPTWRLTDVEGYSGPCSTQIDADGNGGKMTMQVMAGDPPAGVHTAVFSAVVVDTEYTKEYTFELEVKA